MQTRTYVGILLALVVVVVAAFLTYHNADLLRSSFVLGGGFAVPLYLLLLVVFLLGFLPTATVLLVDRMRRDLATRRERRASREGESLDRAFRRAMDRWADGQWHRALEELAPVLEERPSDFTALLLQGELLRRLGRAEEALEVHRRASVLFPQSVALLYQLVDDYEARGEGEVSREIRNRILRDFPDMGLRVLRRRRDLALEGERWSEAAELQARIEALLGGAVDGEGAEWKMEAGVSRGLRYQQGVALLESELWDEAAGVFRQLLEEEPLFTPAVIMLGEAEVLAGREEDGLARWLEGYDRTGSPTFLQRIEDHFIEREEPERAIETLHALLARAANGVLPRFFLGRLYYRLEMLDEAQRELAAVAEHVASSPVYHFLLARIHERRGELGRALESYAACARHLGVTTAEYLCRVCGARYPDWHDRCESCGSWNSVEVDFEEERLSAADLGLHEAPVWGGYEWPKPQTG